jgi:hypothetical protein
MRDRFVFMIIPVQKIPDGGEYYRLSLKIRVEIRE